MVRNLGTAELSVSGSEYLMWLEPKCQPGVQSSDLSSSWCVRPHKGAYVMAAGFPQSEWWGGGDWRGDCHQDGCHSVFYILISEATKQHFCYIQLVTQIIPGRTWEEMTQGCEYQEAGITGGHLGVWLPYFLCILYYLLPPPSITLLLLYFNYFLFTSSALFWF